MAKRAVHRAVEGAGNARRGGPGERGHVRVRVRARGGGRIGHAAFELVPGVGAFPQVDALGLVARRVAEGAVGHLLVGRDREVAGRGLGVPAGGQ